MEIFLIGVSLAMDAFAVSVAGGACSGSLSIRNALRLALYFGGFQALMPLIGWLLSIKFKQLITDFDHWIAFGLLSLIGLKMIYESFKLEDKKKDFDIMDHKVLLILAVATSIDALVVGITFTFMDVIIYQAITIIGCVTFVITFGGYYIGCRSGNFFENKIEAIGGLILIGIGIKILVKDLFFQ